MLQASDLHVGSEGPASDRLLSPSYYLGALKRRLLYFLIPILLIAPAGAAVVMWLPAVYLSEGRLLIESQRIPTELVRPTVTTGAAERIEIMRQRLLTRDNIANLIEKFKLFPDRRSLQSLSELVELVRERAQIKSTELGIRRPGTNQTALGLTIGFEYEQPDIAMRVANELITLLLNEDLRNRARAAGETSKFLEREVKRLQAELAAIQTQVAEVLKAQTATTGSAGQAAIQAALDRHQAFVDEANVQIANLKSERLSKANRLSFNHPEVQAIQRKIVSLEQAIANRPALPQQNGEREVNSAVDTLVKQQAGIQERLNEAADKLAQAQLGEALERDQYAERLEVIEQPTRPQEPIRPKRAKLLALVLGVAVAAGGGLAAGTEFLDKTLRTRGDLARLVENRLIVTIPVIESRRDRSARRMRLLAILATLVLLVAGAVGAAYLFLPPLDVLWQELVTKVPRYLNR